MWQHLGRLARNWKLLSIRKLLYFPHILGEKEKYLLVILMAAALVSGAALITRAYRALTQERPQVGGVYIEGLLREPQTINPIFSLQDTDRDLARLIFSGLFGYDGMGELEPDLANSFEIGDNGKTYTVTLKENLRWQDGSALTAEDVVFTVQLIQNPQYKSPQRANWQGVSVEMLDENRARFSLRTPYAPFIENLTVGIIPKHLWKDVGPQEALLHELNIKPVGSGPYRFKELRHAKDGTLASYELTRNSDYHLEGPYLKRIKFLFFKTEEELLGALRREDIDGFGSAAASAAASQLTSLNPEEFNIARSVMPRVFGLFFNQQRSRPLSDSKVREAIARSLDRKEISFRASPGSAIPHFWPLPPLESLPRESLPDYPFDPEEARRILDDGGWKDEDGDGLREKTVRQNKKSEKMELRLDLITSDWPDLVRSAEAVRENLAAVGMDVNIEVLPFARLENEAIRPRNFEMLLFGEVYGYELDPFPFWHSSQVRDPGLNVALYSSKLTDEKLEEARKSGDPEIRRKNLTEFEALIQRDIPAVFLYSQIYLYVLPKDLKGVEIDLVSLPRDRFNKVNLWYRETQRVLK